MTKKAMIAMSGGVDSSVAALLTMEQGYACASVTLKMFETGLDTCGSGKDADDARQVAERLGMPHEVLDFTGYFADNVIRRFVETYEQGATPNPCIDCNRYIKFEALYRHIKGLGFDYVVTGHYARITYDDKNGRHLLCRAADPAKDQSYVLYTLTQEQLAHTLFPLGELSKPQVREIAEKNGFINAHKSDSQDICFVPDGDYAAFIERYTGKPLVPGDFVDETGRVLGQHRGVLCYTIGQRKGLGLSLPAPLYVCGKSAADNRVILGPHERLFSRHLDACDVNWIAFDGAPSGPIRVKAKVRYKQAEQWATVTPTGDRTMCVVFDEPQRAIAAGQAVVLYDGDVVVGGGTIV